MLKKRLHVEEMASLEMHDNIIMNQDNIIKFLAWILDVPQLQIVTLLEIVWISFILVGNIIIRYI